MLDGVFGVYNSLDCSIMGCVLHFTGDHVDIDALADISPVQPATVFRRGEPRSSRPNSRVCVTSGLNFLVSSADCEDFEQQQDDAIEFLTVHQLDLPKMRQFEGVTSASLDFGIAMRNVISQSDQFQPELITLMAPLGLALVLSQYPVGRKNSKVKQYRRALRKAI